MPARPHIRAKRTEAFGVKFRSILESEWATWLVENRIAWKYEPKTFRIGGVGYKPDFLLPDLGLWLEVKPYAPKRIEILKCAWLNLATKQLVVIGAGHPGEGSLVFEYREGYLKKQHYGADALLRLVRSR